MVVPFSIKYVSAWSSVDRRGHVLGEMVVLGSRDGCGGVEKKLLRKAENGRVQTGLAAMARVGQVEVEMSNLGGVGRSSKVGAWLLWSCERAASQAQD